MITMAKPYNPSKSKRRKTKRNTKRICEGKVRYRDKQEAVRALHRLQVRSVRDDTPERVYFHPECKGYHLTSKPWNPDPRRHLHAL